MRGRDLEIRNVLSTLPLQSNSTDEARRGGGVEDGGLETVEARDKVDSSIAVKIVGNLTRSLDIRVELVVPGPVHQHSGVVDGALRQEDGLLPDPPGHERDETIERGVGRGGDHVLIRIIKKREKNVTVPRKDPVPIVILAAPVL